MKKKKPTTEEMPGRITFVDKKGTRFHIHKDRTLKDLVGLGVTAIRLEKQGSFLPSGLYELESISPRTKKTTNKKEK